MQRDVASNCGLPTAAYAIAGQQDKEWTVSRGDVETRRRQRNYFIAGNAKNTKKQKAGDGERYQRREKY
jgi:hypothetical protein